MTAEITCSSMLQATPNPITTNIPSTVNAVESNTVTASSVPSMVASNYKTSIPPQSQTMITKTVEGGAAVGKHPAPATAQQVVATRRQAPVPSSVPVTSLVTATTVSSRVTTKSKKKKGSIVSGSQGAQGENTGRWTADEHRLFLQGLEQHGKGWKKIASLIKSRTVVQIRTHAQKYFQKLAKARQNGEEGDVTMEGRGGVAVIPSAVSTATAAQTSKRRRQTTGTKRKVIHSVVASAQRQGKKMALQQANSAMPNPVPPLPAVAPALAHFVLPNATTSLNGSNGGKGAPGSIVSSVTTAQGTISGPALEDSLFRFLTPAPVATSEPQVNIVARQAGANPITLPTDNPSAAPTVDGGETSPTGVSELTIYPSWTDAKDTPSWYAKGADVDALLDVGDALDWLADTGDLNETYQPPSIESAPTLPEIESSRSVNELVKNSASVSTLPYVDSNVESVVPPLPSLFADGPSEVTSVPSQTKSLEIPATLSNDHLNEAAEGAGDLDEHLQVFDTPMEEHDFVSTILEDTNESADSLPVLN